MADYLEIMGKANLLMENNPSIVGSAMRAGRRFGIGSGIGVAGNTALNLARGRPAFSGSRRAGMLGGLGYGIGGAAPVRGFGTTMINSFKGGG